MFQKALCAFFAPFFLVFVCGCAFAQGSARVNMRGAVIESACAIDTTSRDQSIEMGVMPVSHVGRDGVGSLRPFTIKLFGCTLHRYSSEISGWQGFRVTFDGGSGSGLFAVHGSAKGVALKISDSNGSVARPGESMRFGNFIPGDNVLNYSIRLVGNGAQIRSGEYLSTIRFKMDYY